MQLSERNIVLLLIFKKNTGKYADVGSCKHTLSTLEKYSLYTVTFFHLSFNISHLLCLSAALFTSLQSKSFTSTQFSPLHPATTMISSFSTSMNLLFDVPLDLFPSTSASLYQCHLCSCCQCGLLILRT